MDLPEFIQNAPELDPWLELYWEAYQDLSTCRPAGFSGVSPIPWLSVKEYAEANDYDEEQASDLAYFTRIMDRAFLQWYEKQHGHKQKRTGISGSNGTARKVSGLGG